MYPDRGLPEKAEAAEMAVLEHHGEHVYEVVSVLCILRASSFTGMAR